MSASRKQDLSKNAKADLDNTSAQNGSIIKSLIVCGIIIILDQITKAIIVLTIPINNVAGSLFGDFFMIVHDRNTGMAFSIMGGADPTLRVIFLVILPLIVMAGLGFYIIKGKLVTGFQRILLGGILGGGIGNLIDRIFRPEGVVDFASFKFYGLLGMERFPTFNIADSALVISSIILAINILFFSRERKV